MYFTGPDSNDLANVHALNCAFIELLRHGRRVCADEQSASIATRLAPIGAERAARLARCPFLLMSLKESDERRWQRLFAAEPQRDLVDLLDGPDGDAERLLGAVLGFLWQLAKQNTFATRLISGAGLGWCEQLASSTLFDVLQLARRQGDLLTVRLAGNGDFWNKLLGAGTSAEKDVRDAAHLSALQTILTSDTGIDYRRLPAAACSMPRPSIRTDRR